MIAGAFAALGLVRLLPDDGVWVYPRLAAALAVALLPGWLIADFDTRWEDPAQRAELMTLARALESEPAMLGVSAHLLAIARKS